MIFDKKGNAGIYKGISKNLKTAFLYLTSTDFSVLEAGRYEVDGDNVYALVQAASTRLKADAKWEGHHKYIDIQYIVEGTELMGVQEISAMKVSKEYDDVKDALFFEDNGSGLIVKVTSGHFAVFFPTDAHMPLLAETQPMPVKKVVIKVKV